MISLENIFRCSNESYINIYCQKEFREYEIDGIPVNFAAIDGLINVYVLV